MTPSDYLFDPRPPLERDPSFSVRPRHDGPHLEERDQRRLGTLQDRVWEFMRDGAWRTLREIADACGGSEASVSARCRDFKKERFAKVYGPVELQKERLTDGVWRYRLEVH